MPATIFPLKWSSMTYSSKAAYNLLAHFVQEIFGLLHNPTCHWFKQTGEYPDVDFFLFSHHFAYTSSRSLKSDMDSLIFEMESDVLFTFRNEAPSFDSSLSMVFSAIIFVMLFLEGLDFVQAALSIYCFLLLSDYSRLLKYYIFQTAPCISYSKPF